MSKDTDNGSMEHADCEAKGSLTKHRYTVMGESPKTPLIAWVAKPGQRRSVEGAVLSRPLGHKGPQTPQIRCQRHFTALQLFGQVTRNSRESSNCLDHLRSMSHFHHFLNWGVYV